jgi:FkbM family methyltransferase
MTQLAVELLSLYLRRTPWERGRWRLVPLVLRWSRSARQAHGRRTVKTRDGFRLCVELGDWLGRHIYVMGEYEPATTQIIKALLQSGDTFIDVGANIGYFTLLATSRVGSTGKVFAFEPVPETRGMLLRNLRLNRVANVVVREEAVADQAGEVTLFIGPANHRGTSSMRSLPDSSGVLEVPKGRLDDLLPAGERVRLIKIDIEGAEYLALEGMSRCLRQDRPDLVIEVTDSFLRAMGHSAAMLCKLLFGLGYRMYAIDHDGLTPITDFRAPLPAQFNALFTARADLPARLRVKVEPHSTVESVL